MMINTKQHTTDNRCPPEQREVVVFCVCCFSSVCSAAAHFAFLVYFKCARVRARVSMTNGATTRPSLSGRRAENRASRRRATVTISRAQVCGV